MPGHKMYYMQTPDENKNHVQCCQMIQSKCGVNSKLIVVYLHENQQHGIFQQEEVERPPSQIV